MRFLLRTIFLWSLLLGVAWADFKVGVILPLSGLESERGRIIRDFLLELNQELTWNQGLALKLRFYDSKGHPAYLSLLVEEALFDDVDLLIGPLIPQGAEELVRKARDLELPVIITSGEVNPIKYLKGPLGPVFRTGLSTRLAVKALYRCLKQKGIRHVGLLISTDAFGREGERWLMAYATENAIKILKKSYFGVDDTDVSLQLRDLLSCEAVICWAPPGASNMVAKNLARENLKLPVYFSHVVAREGFLRKTPFLQGRPFVGVAFYSGRPLVNKVAYRVLKNFLLQHGYPRDPALAAYGDALIFVWKGVLKGGFKHWVQGLESLGLVRGLTGLYFLSKDDHYGLLPGSVGVYFYRWSTFKAVCYPKEGLL